MTSRSALKHFVSLCAWCVIGLCSRTYAASETGNIEPGWYIYEGGVVFFTLPGTQVSRTCSIPEPWAIDTNTASGKLQFAAFIAAYAQKQWLEIYSDGTCVHGNTEKVVQLHVN